MVFKVKTLRDRIARAEVRLAALRDDFDAAARPDYADRLRDGHRRLGDMWNEIARHPSLRK